MNNLKGKLYAISDEDFIFAVSVCNNINSIMCYLKLNTRRRIKDRIKNLNLNTDHFISKIRTPAGELFIENCSHSRSVIRHRILRDNLIPYVCFICEQRPNWNGEPLTLVLDHINGVFNDNRLYNLRFLCPNCNSQTKTFCGRNTQRAKKFSKKVICPFCKVNTKYFSSTRCKECAGLKSRKIIDRPSFESLKVLLKDSSYVKVAKIFNVSNNTVGKWYRSYVLEELNNSKKEERG